MSCVFPAYHSSFNGANYLLVKIMEIIKWSETSQLSALIRVCHINIFILFKKKKKTFLCICCLKSVNHRLVLYISGSMC